MPRRAVVELDAKRAAAHAARGDRMLAAAAVALPDLAPDVSGDVLWIRRRARLVPRLLHEPVPLRLALEEEVDPGLDDLREPRAGVPPRPCRARVAAG
jgi:hypothetical protein